MHVCIFVTPPEGTFPHRRHLTHLLRFQHVKMSCDICHASSSPTSSSTSVIHHNFAWHVWIVVGFVVGDRFLGLRVISFPKKVLLLRSRKSFLCWSIVSQESAKRYALWGWLLAWNLKECARRQVQLWMEMPNVKFLANVKKSSEKSFTTIISTKVIMSQFWNGNHDLKNAIFLHISATLNPCFLSYTCFGEDFALTFLAICRNPGAEWSVTKWRKHEGHIRYDHYWPTCIRNTNKEIWRNTNAQI